MNIKITSFEKSQKEIRMLRDTVFGVEQKVERHLDWDGKDDDCIHVLALDADQHPLGTGRLMPDGRIGRLCVLKRLRSKGLGARMLEALVAAAEKKGFKTVNLHAQIHAADFYEKQGFKKDGQPFTEAGIVHINMNKKLSSEDL